MKIILEPKVTLISRPLFIPHPDYPIPDDGTDAEKLCSFSGKSCYDSFGVNGRSNTENQRAIIQSKHGSAIEHAHFSFFIEGITRALSLELNRHRPNNISQRSTRYTKEEESAIVLEPNYAKLYNKYNMVFGENDIWTSAEYSASKDWNMDEYTLIKEFLNNCQNAIDSYKTQVETLMKLNPNNLTGFDLRKWCRGKARNILPHALETRGTYTFNLRSIRFFLELRSESHAETEIRVLANKMYECVKDYAPVYFEDFEHNEVDGIDELIPKYSKI